MNPLQKHCDMEEEINCNIYNLKKLFGCCAPLNQLKEVLKKLRKIESDGISVNLQNEILNNTVNNICIKKYPVKNSYQRALLKLLINELEQSSSEISENVYIAYCNAVSLPDEVSLHYRHFYREDDDLRCITILESTRLIQEETTGLHVWQAALNLATWCSENREMLLHKNILELGSGVGLTGLSVISTCSPKQYIFSDCNESVLSLLCDNVKLNLCTQEEGYTETGKLAPDRSKLIIRYKNTEVNVINLRWEEIDEYIKEDWLIPDVIIASDILYDSDFFDALINVLNSLLTANNYAIIAATIRNSDTARKFYDKLEAQQDLTFVECKTQKEDFSIELGEISIQILKIFKKHTCS